MKILQMAVAVVAGWAVLLFATASAFNINLVYPGGTLFSSTYDQIARNAIEAAAADVSAAITTNLAAINNDEYMGNSGNNTITYNWSYSHLNPLVDGGNTVIETATIPANTVSIYVGARSILGSTLGEGGPGGMGLNISYSYINANQLPAAAASADSKSELAYKRGGGPVIGTLALSNTLAGVTINTSVDYGVAYGSLALDWDGNNNGAKDTDSQLNNYWHFNHATSVAAGKNDLYSVALHEILHAIGIGSSASWDAMVSGTNWSGAHVASLVGTGTGMINGTGDHIAEGKLSTRASDGSLQEAAMDPTITQGKRKFLTALDLAFLRDIGYSTIDWVTAPSSPADFDNDGDVDTADLALWQGGYGMNAISDADGDGDSDGRDFLVWQREHTGPAPFTATITVPEPSTFVLMSLSGMAVLGRHRGTR